MGGAFETMKSDLDQAKEQTGLPTVFLAAIPKLNDQGRDVTQLQLRLNEVAKAGLKADGIFGPATRDAVAAFQKSIKLAGTGVIGEKTLAGLVMAVMAKPAEPAWLTIARKELGTKEVGGTKHNPRIIEYHAATSGKFKDDETAWCSSFANWCMKEAGVKGTNSAWARDWLKWGVKLDKPRMGCVVVVERGSAGGTSHVAFYTGETETHIKHIGGNQSNAVTETLTPKSVLLGYRWPKE